MNEPAYRDNAPAPVLPVAGARVHTLQRAGGVAHFALMAVWLGTIFFVSVLGLALDGNVPEAVLPWVAAPLVLGGLVAAGLVYRRLATSGSRWRLHHADDRMVLERVEPREAFDLARTALRTTRYEWSARGGRGAMPTVTIELGPARTLVVSGPVGVGWQNLDEEAISAELGFGSPAGPPPERSPSPHVRLDDAAAFHALSALASRARAGAA